MVPHMWPFCLRLDFQGSPWPPSCFPWDLDPSSLLGFLKQTYKPALSCLKGRVNHDGVYCPHESHLSVCRMNGGMGKLDCSQERFSLSQVWLWKEKPYTGEERWAEQQESTAHPEFTVLSDVRGAVDHHVHPTECLGSNEDSHTTSTNKTWGTFKWQPVLIFCGFCIVLLPGRHLTALQSTKHFSSSRKECGSHCTNSTVWCLNKTLRTPTEKKGTGLATWDASTDAVYKVNLHMTVARRLHVIYVGSAEKQR